MNPAQRRIPPTIPAALRSATASAALDSTVRRAAANGTCVPCPDYLLTTNGYAPCPFNTYKSERGAGSCQKCPVGSYSAMGSTKITDCQCGTGSYLLPDDGYCMPCYSASPLLCPAGLHSFEGVTDLELCLCPVGYYKDVYLRCWSAR